MPAFRHFKKAQLGFEVWNRSSFPISLKVMSAETRIEGITPPRGRYPKDPVIIQPGMTMWLHDDAMDMEEMICDNLDGEMDITVQYGLPGKERFEIRHHGTVEIFMEAFGQYKGLYFHPAGETALPG